MLAARITIPAGLVDSRFTLEKSALRVTDLVIKHLRRKNFSTAPNRFGLPKSNYYAEAADTVQHVTDGNRFTVSVGTGSTDPDAKGVGIALHYFGGTVYPKKKALAIPVDRRVAGIWPSEYARSHKLFKTPGGALGDAETGEILWFLLPKATIPADPSVLPTDDEIMGAAILGIKSALS